MSTECSHECFDFHLLNRRDVVARFYGWEITSDAGALLLRKESNARGSFANGPDVFPTTGGPTGSSTASSSF